jgi:hypothetical protein
MYIQGVAGSVRGCWKCRGIPAALGDDNNSLAVLGYAIVYHIYFSLDECISQAMQPIPQLAVKLFAVGGATEARDVLKHGEAGAKFIHKSEVVED